MRRAARIDENQPAIVKHLREAGVAVQPLSAVGDGCPDLLVSWQGVNVLIEVKNPDKPKSDRKLTPDQVEWHANWKGPVYVVENHVTAMAKILEAVNEARS